VLAVVECTETLAGEFGWGVTCEAHGAIAGEVDLRWKGVRGGRMYQVYICDGDPTTAGKWTIAGMSSKARFTVKGLVTDKKYSFRATALGVVGEGPVSGTVTAQAA